jgi:hypothetical protein
MGKNSTLIVLLNKKDACDKPEILDVNRFIEETDSYLNKFFKHADVKVADKLVKKTLAKCMNS